MKDNLFYLDYVEFIEYFYRYIQLARTSTTKKVPFIPYNSYRGIKKYLEKHPLTQDNAFNSVKISRIIDTGYYDTKGISYFIEIANSEKMADTTTLAMDDDDAVATLFDYFFDWVYNYESQYSVSYVPASYFNIRSNALFSKKDSAMTKKTTEKKQEKQEEKTMKNMTNSFNFEFGVVKGDEYRMSPYGMAVMSGGTFKAYDPNAKNIVEVGDFTFKMDGAFFKMPIAVEAIKSGDMLMVKGNPMFVVDTKDGIKAIDIAAGEMKTVMPTTNIFGFNYMTKVVSMFDNMNMFGGMTAPTKEQPFGNMMPFMMMSSMFGKDGFDFGEDMGKLMMVSMMMGNNQNPFAAMVGQVMPQSNANPQ